jgi:hypothetical protein
MLHLDWLDDDNTYAFVICVGPGWEGGSIEFPQLGISIPTQPGTVIGGLMRKLAHRCTEVIGERLVLTCFTDKATVERAKAAFPDFFDDCKWL